MCRRHIKVFSLTMCAESGPVGILAEGSGAPEGSIPLHPFNQSYLSDCAIWQCMDLLKHFYAVVRQIPRGRISTYGSIAIALGDKRAARAVGRMLHHNIYAPEVPCHRVVMSDGGIGGFGTGVDNKIRLLSEEGVVVKEGKIVDFDRLLFIDFITSYPLGELRDEQIKNALKVRLKDEFDGSRLIAGVDVAYITDEKKDTQTALGAMVVWDMVNALPVKVVTVKVEVDFPYIPTYLSHREFPLIEKLVSDNNNFDILMVDGNGVLHPRGIGLASHSGLKLDKPTIGVAKGGLSGTVKETNDPKLKEILIDERLAGYSFLSSNRATRPIYVSPGHRISFGSALALVRRMCIFKIPEPLRLAHIEVVKARKIILEKTKMARSHELTRGSL